MRWFYNLKISAKLIVAFLLVAAIAGVVGMVGLVNINNMRDADTLLYEENTLGMEYAGNAAVYFQRIRFNCVKMTLEGEGNLSDGCIKNILDYTTIVDENLKLYDEGIVSDADRKQFDELKPRWEQYKSLNQSALELVQEGQTDQAQELVLFGEVPVVGAELQGLFEGLLDYNSDAGKERMDQNIGIADTASKTMITVIIIGVVIAIILGLFISRIISVPISKMAEAADKLAVGDVDVSVESDTKDEIGRLAQSFRGMVENIREQAFVVERIAAGDLTVEVNVRSDKDLLGKKLSEVVETNNEILGNINAAAGQVAAGSKQVSDSSMLLSQGAAEQASSVEELTASLEEVSTQTKQNAENAHNANELAEAAKDNAERGHEQMAGMLRAMEEINDSSSNISRIIKVIDEIAFQTNILALNAAVEAARAGQHGKGFAVVAEEVRNLAARSANAAKETTELIEGSIKRTENGTRIANDTAAELEKIVSDIAQAARLVADIDVASNEQAAAVAQINQGIMQVSQVVQTNSATSEEGAAASEELSGQAEFLRESVAKFKLRHTKQSAHSGYKAMTPEIMNMVADVTEKKKQQRNTNKQEDWKEFDIPELGNPNHGAKSMLSAPNHKIIMDDKELEKY